MSATRYLTLKRISEIAEQKRKSKQDTDKMSLSNPESLAYCFKAT